MDVRKYVSINYLQSKIARDFNMPTTGWVDRVEEWVGEVLEEIGGTRVVVPVTHTATIDDSGYVDMPCEITALIGVSQGTDGCWLDRITFSTNNPADLCYELYMNEGNKLKFYNITGDVVIHYYKLPKDCNGELLVFDDPVLIKAITWYVLQMCLLGGMKHPVIDFQFAKREYEKLMADSINRTLMATINEFPYVFRHFPNPIV
jgi:hypothetical protein